MLAKIILQVLSLGIPAIVEAVKSRRAKRAEQVPCTARVAAAKAAYEEAVKAAKKAAKR